MVVTCDNCKEKVEIGQSNLSKERIRGGIEEIFFHCPTCNEKYSVCITDREIRKLQRLIQKTVPYKRELLQARLRKMMDDLNNKGV